MVIAVDMLIGFVLLCCAVQYQDTRKFDHVGLQTVWGQTVKTGSTGKIAQGDMSRQVMVGPILESKQVWMTAPILTADSPGDCRGHG